MQSAGGLKLELKARHRADRRSRFAQVSIAPLRGDDELTLVTDSRGRLRYRLPPGDYRLRLDHAPDTPFAVRHDGWTTVRVALN